MKKNLQIITSGELWSSSQVLMDLLLEQRFAQVHEMGIFDHRASQGKYYKGGIFHFRKYGDCRIGFLKDGRVHVLNGPSRRKLIVTDQGPEGAAIRLGNRISDSV